MQALLATELTSRRSDLVGNLAVGLDEFVASIESGIDLVRAHTERGDLGDSLTSYEFDDVLMHRLDRLGFAMLQVADMAIRLPEGLLVRIRGLESELRALLPNVVRSYRKAADPVDDIDREQFPRSFWWRRLRT